MNDFRVHMRHIRAARLCSSGARAWFAQRNIDWQCFLRDGVPAQLLIDQHDAFADRVIAIARQEHEAS